MYQGMFLGTGRAITLFLYAMLAGALRGSAYDILRALRISIRHHPAVVAAEDFAFCALFGAIYYALCVSFTEGALRMFLLAGMLAGFGVYLVSLGRIVCGILSKVFGLAANFYMIVVKIIKKIIRYLCGLTVFQKLKK